MKISLKAVRTNADLSQSDVAKKMKVSKSTVSRWERGSTPIPLAKMEEFCAICHHSIQNVSANVKQKILKGENSQNDKGK